MTEQEEFEEYDDGFVDEEAAAAAHEAEVMRILEEYRARQLREHLTGPIISFFLHIIVLFLLTYLVRGKPEPPPPPIQVVVEEVEIKELEEPMVEEIEEVEEEEITEEAPSMEVEAPTPVESTADSAIEDASDDAPETDDDMDFEEVLDVAPTSTPLKLAGLYGGRTKAGRAGSVRRFGGSKRGQDAVLKALRWLASVQRADGSWQNHGAHTGLALLCFLAHGETPLSEEFGLTVQKGMQWLANGMPTGDRIFGNRAYTHGIATYALAEAYGMTQIPFLRTAMENGLAKIVEGQQRGGGFDYRYAKGARWDLSVGGWQYQAMKAGYVAGASTPGLYDAIERGIKHLRQDVYKNYKFGYSSPGGGGNMTGVGTVALQLLGEPKCKEAVGGCETIAESRLAMYSKYLKEDHDYWLEHAGHPIYGWYYDTQAMFHRGGRTWKKWNSVFEKVLVKNQHKEGYWESEKGHGGGRSLTGKIFTTTLCCLQLEVYYRYLPTFKMPKQGFIKEAKGGLMDDEDTGLIIE
jgi:hypothetical protein